MSDQNTTILDSPIVGILRGRRLEQPYRAILAWRNGKPVIRIEQQHSNGSWGPTPGGWYLSTLQERRPDRIALDFGQQWEAEGLAQAITEAEDLTYPEDASETDAPT